MIPVKTIETKADQIIAGTPTAAQLAQLVAVGDYIDDVQVLTAATVAALPSAANNKGIIYYVTATQKYYFSDGTNWRSDFTSDYELRTLTGYAWGYNSFGQLGDNTTVAKSSPINVIGNINWQSISAGNYSNIGITSTGVAYAWGRNNFGQLGDNTTSVRSSPVTVVGGITNWNQVSVGQLHVLGITTSGIAYAWGSNTYRQLGDNTLTGRSSPVLIVGGITNWNQVSAGRNHSIGSTTTGILYSWGYNSKGQLGDNTTTMRSSPVVVVGGITNWRQGAAGLNATTSTHSLGLTSSGILYAWGSDNSGQLGILGVASVSYSSPVTVVGGITSWSQIVASTSCSLGLTSTGIIYGWGLNNVGQLGDNTTSNRSSPVTTVGGISNWSQISSFSAHCLGLTSSGIIYAWGLNNYGRLGDNTTSARSSPVSVVGGITNWSQVSAGDKHSISINTVTQYTKGFV